jgi:hypothetical protein
MQTLVEQYVSDPENMRAFQQELAIYHVTELIEQVMSEVGVSRAELAKLLGRSKAWVTQLLDGEGNKTIRTVADALAVLGREFRGSAPRIGVGAQPVAESTVYVPIGVPYQPKIAAKYRPRTGASNLTIEAIG